MDGLVAGYWEDDVGSGCLDETSYFLVDLSSLNTFAAVMVFLFFNL
jgi:hypothetical protein